MIDIIIDNKKYTVQDDLTILEAAGIQNIKIPVMCHLKGYDHHTSCMICLVKEKRSGKFLPACSSPAGENMEIDTCSDEVKKARQESLALLLSEHTGDCIAPCQRGCPAHPDIPKMIYFLKLGKIEAALFVIKKSIPFPAIAGRICPAPCEKNCRRHYYENPVAICRLQQFVGDWGLDPHNGFSEEITARQTQSIAVIGAGPAGLSAAYYLLISGFKCSIYEKENHTGGTLLSHITEDRLQRVVIDLEKDNLQKMGAVFYFGCNVGRNITIEQLKEKHDAVIIATGRETHYIFNLDKTAEGIAVNPMTFRTSDDAVFAAGSVIKPIRMVVRSMAMGRDAAFYLCSQFTGSRQPAYEKNHVSIIKKFNKEIYKQAYNNPKPQVVPLNGINQGYTAKEAIEESGRCLECDCFKAHGCALREYAIEYNAKQEHMQETPFREPSLGKRVVYDPGKCIKCGRCVRLTEKSGVGMTFVNRGYRLTVDTPFGVTLDQALGGLDEHCVRSCPTGALSFKNHHEREAGVITANETGI